MEKKRDQEKKVVTLMIRLYCVKNHRQGGLCEDCSNLEKYCYSKIDRCPNMETKTFCSSCRTHCYKPEMREKIRRVMRYSGPRMIFYHPVLAVRHLLQGRR